MADDKKVIFSMVGVSKIYPPQKQVLKDIYLSFFYGAKIGIIGLNGAGKSTLSNLICGFLKPGQGRILFGGEDIADWSIKERGEKIGLVMQNPNQMISKPMIYEEVALGLTVRGVPEEEIRERVYETLKICGLYQFRNWPVSALSFGQKKRVTIASILVMKPEILILDDSSSALDYATDAALRKAIKEKTDHTTVFLVSQRASSIMYADKIVVLDDGKIAGIGDHDTLMKNCPVYQEIYASQNKEVKADV